MGFGPSADGIGEEMSAKLSRASNTRHMITMRDARESDLPEILAIVQRGHRQYDCRIQLSAAYHGHAKDLVRQSSKGRTSRVVAEAEGRVAGFSSYGPLPAWPAYKYTVEKLSMSPQTNGAAGSGNY